VRGRTTFTYAAGTKRIPEGSVYEYNFFGKERYRVGIPLPTGDVEIVLDHTQKPFKQFVENTGGPANLFINGELAGEGEIANVTPWRFSAHRDPLHRHGSQVHRFAGLPRQSTVRLHGDGAAPSPIIENGPQMAG